MTLHEPAASPIAIEPGLMVIHGNRQEDLRDLLLAWLRRAPLHPLENELVLVQSNGIAQWLKLALARPAAQGGMGISAAISLQLPGRFLWNAYRSVLGEAAVPPTSPFDKSRLLWRLLRLLPALGNDSDFAPLKNLLGDTTDWRRLYRLALQIADVFDQYQVYRAGWLSDWEHQRDVLHDTLRDHTVVLPRGQRWQPRLWRMLLDDMGVAQQTTHRAAIHAQFIQRLARAGQASEGVPRRIVVFGITSLPQQTLEALTALSRFSQILLLVTNPCRHYWADIIEDRELLKAAQRRHADKPTMPADVRFEDLHLHANPLLAAWGKQGRDFIRQLDDFDQPERYRSAFTSLKRSIDVFEDIGSDGLLHQVQQAVLDLEPLPADLAQRKMLSENDPSLRFHIAHSPQREVEILHDQLLAIFEQAAREGQPLSPRDIMVMVPDIRIYAPHVQAVFGRIASDDARYLPYSVTDRPTRGAAPLLVALENLLALPESRFTAGDVLDLLDVPALRQRFELSEDDVPVLRRWIEQAGVRWGLHGAQKETLGLPAEEQHSWRFGLRRLLLGYAVGDGPSLEGIAPFADIGGLDAALLGPLCQLLERLEHYWQLLGTSATPAQWSERLRRMLRDFFDTRYDDTDTLRLDRLDDALETWLDACNEADFKQPLPVTIVRDHWLQAIDESRLTQRFMGGAVNFGTLLPMRAIPFRVVCLLGMNDGDYPRQIVAPDFDLMALPGQHRPGDRSRREDDRYLFLEALLSARDALHISWVGRSARDNSELPPSVLVSQLRDYLARGWRSNDPAEATLDVLTAVHPMQAFSARYFTATGNASDITYALEWEAARDRAPAELPSPPYPFVAPQNIDIDQLQRFLLLPAKAFFDERLGVRFTELDGGLDDDEAFGLDALQRRDITERLLRQGLDTNTPIDVPTLLIRLHEEGRVPVGGFGAIELAHINANAQAAVMRWQQLAVQWPHAQEPQTLRFVGGSIIVEGTLDNLFTNSLSHTARMLILPDALSAKGGRYDRLVNAWVPHLFANACGIALTTYISGVDAQAILKPIDRVVAGVQLNALIDDWTQGMQAPLPISRRTALAWLQAEQNNKPPHAAAESVYDGSDAPHAPMGEVHYESTLARNWPSFKALFDAGFTTWLRLYRPLLEHAVIEQKRGEQTVTEHAP